MPSTTKEAIEGTPIVMLAMVTAKMDVERYIAFEVTKLTQSVNVDQRLTIQTHQIKPIAEHLMNEYKAENLADITLALKRGAMGYYGEVYRIDLAVICGWMDKYLQEKYTLVEAKAVEAKKETEAQHGVNYEAYKAKLAKQAQDKKPASNAKENEYQRERLKYTPPTAEYVKARDLHLAWIKANFDPRTQNKLEGWMSEEEWIKQQTENL